MQSLVGAIGVGVTWVYLYPFGFIYPTNLVGTGLCNNPFYRGKGTKKLIPPRDPGRSAFGNHAFIEHDKIHDACAGPHLGTESRSEYVKSSIDVETTLWRRYLAGDVEWMEDHLGVMSVK